MSHLGSGAPARTPARWRWPLLIAAIGLIVSTAAAFAMVVRERAAAGHALATRGATIEATLREAVGDGIHSIDAVGAFVRSSNLVMEAEFDRFVSDASGLTDGVFGLGMIRVIPADRLARFNAGLAFQHPGSFVFEVDGLQPVPVGDRRTYYPIQYFASDDDLPAWGFDAGSDPALLDAITRALETDELVATGFVSFPGRPDVDGVVLFERVEAPIGGGTIGLIAVAMDSSDVLAGVAGTGAQSEIRVDVADVTNLAPAQPSGAWTATIPVADRSWRLDVFGESSARSVLVGLVVFVAGVALSALLAAMAAGYTSHTRQRRELTQLRRLDRQKDDFLATVSHELRTPLTSIVGFSDALRDDDGFDRSERREMVEFIAEEATAMEGIVQDLLVAARLQQGGVVPISIGIVADLAVEAQRIARQVAVIRSAPTTVVGTAAVMADSARVRQIIRNLIDNAARHGKPPVEVTIEERNGRVGMVVTDHGTGVPESAVESLFDRYRSGPNPEGLPASTVIGLWLSRELARLMGGDLYHLGGSAFELVLVAAPVVEESPLDVVGSYPW